MTDQTLPRTPSVLILMCTLNGARWLPQQLASLAAQSHADWALWVSDDGSNDGTLAIVDAFRAVQAPRREVRILAGPRRGAAQNFLSLVVHPDLPAAPGVYAALCDQDDVWMPDKLARALDRIAAAPDPGRPVIYGAGSVLIGQDGRRIGASRRRRRPDLGNAVVQNVIGGHAMVLNPAALALARRAGTRPVPFQDWWLTLLVLACGGTAIADPAEVLYYRQHDGNFIGAARGPAAYLRRLRMLFGRDYAGWVAANLDALAASPVALTAEARAILDAMRAAPPRPGPARPWLMRRLGLHRQSRFGTFALYLAAAFGRV